MTSKFTSPADFLSSSRKQKYISNICRKTFLDNFDQCFSSVSPYQNDVIFHLLNTEDFYQGFSKNLPKKSLADFFDKTKLSFWPFISSSAVSNYVSNQLALPLKLRDNDFRKSLRKGIVELSKIFFNKQTSRFISGIKIICSGR